MKKSKRAIFLDRDGTIINERGYLSDPRKMVFYPGVFRALVRLRKAGYKLVVITNQSGVGRGFFTLADLKKINRHFKKVMLERGVRIDGIYFCPHLPDAGCSCRKPRPGLAKRAARDLGLDLRRSYVVGDQAGDMRLAANIGAKGILVLTGAGLETKRNMAITTAKIAKNLSSAAGWILSHAPIK